MKIEKISFHAGSSPEARPLELEVAPVTVFVGPNYSGKSKAIEEIAGILRSGFSKSGLVISGVDVARITDTEADDILESLLLEPLPNETLNPQFRIYGTKGSRTQLPPQHFKQILMNPASDPSGFSSWYAQHRILTLNGSNRISLVNDQSGGDLQSPAATSFQTIFRDDKLRGKLRNIVYDAFGLYLAVDPTALGHLRLRLSSVLPPSSEVERGLTSDSIAYHGASTLVTATSDGAKAFIGIIVEILAGNPDVLFIDEPEACLHPSLSFLLGKEIAQEVGASGKQMFVSTHSPNFIMGCLQSGVGVNVIRLTYRNGSATARLLPGDELRRMIRNPLLRSTGVLSALFYESVIVTEGDPDRAFYQEVNERLLREDKGRGIPNAIFLNAQNKQTIPTIVSPLRRLGIPAAAIYDIDLVKDGGRTATSFLQAAGVPDISQQSLNVLRSAVHLALQGADQNFKRTGGINLLSGTEKLAAQDYLDHLKAYGAFVVPHGELEQWLPSLGVTGHGPSWLIPLFEAMGEDPTSQDFVRAGKGDVWDFLDEVRAWLHDAARKGIPI